MRGDKIKVLVVEDSGIARELLMYLLARDPQIDVVGWAADGMEAISAVERLQPDVVTMDICMPIMDGYESTRRIMESHPLPIIIVSAVYNPDDVQQTFRAMDAGAVAAVEKPAGPGAAAQLIDTVKAMSEVKVVKRWARARGGTPVPISSTPRLEADRRRVQLVAIGASTGGPPVLHTILSGLPKPYGLPVVIVQHITPGFVRGMAQWLTQVTGMQVTVAEEGEMVLAGNAYLAPDGRHMGVSQDLHIVCESSAPEHGVRPSVSYLFRSVASEFGARAAGVILTGMGCDGASELKRLNDLGGLTVAQDMESSIVNGMPGAAVALGAAKHILPPNQIAATLAALSNKTSLNR